MPLLGIIEIPTSILQDEEIMNLLLDNFTVLEQRSNPEYNSTTMLCVSDYFDEITEEETVPCYHVDLKIDNLNDNKLYIWQVIKAD